jgi:multidrug efflux system membrane fusion protein
MKMRMGYPALAAMAALLLFPACARKEGAAAQGGRGAGRRGAILFPVETLRVQDRAVTTTLSAVGSVEAFEKVQVTARVAGVVEKVLFAEGSRVASGQVLVEIEPERYKLAVASAQAAHNKAVAAKGDADAGLKRRETVDRQNPGLIPGEEIETWRTKVLVAAAEMAQTAAALNQAQLNLHDAYVRAPVGGVMQTRTVQTGQYVQPGAVLATLVRRDPLLLRFQATESDAARLQSGMSAFFKVHDNDRAYQARIIHVAAAADDSTRMVAVTAEVTDRERGALRAGAFAEVTVPVGNARPLPVVPQAAIRPSEKGFLAYVVVDGKAVERILVPGMRTADGSVEVLSGLKAGDLLVVRGAEALSDGVAVRVAGEPPAEGKAAKPAAPAAGGR